MAPAADMKWDAQAMAECFYLSNMVPQVGKGMNQGIWRILEDKVRDWAISRGEIYIYTGPIYDGKEELKVIGKNKVAVPSALFKVVFSPEDQKVIAFIMPNRSLNTKDMPKYIVSVREVENETGLDFFATLSKEIQDSFESEKAPVLWEKKK
jgi:endonuclease G